ncbi:MAG TPA: hypothetical protein VFQ24_10595 [Terriglobia bacterium]|nr:hypothetical protein [Terriglobia bacterium]
MSHRVIKPREVIGVLCAIAVAGIGATLLLRHRHPRMHTQIVSAPVSAVRTPVVPVLDRAAYNEKMLEIANLPPRGDCSPSPSTGPSGRKRARAYRTVAAARPVAYVTKQTVLRPCPAPLWPVHAAYPDAGAVLPFKRIVAYYGNFYSTRMGILGEYPPDKVLQMLKAAAASWAAADPSTPVVPAVDYIAVSGQNVPTRDGKYRLRMPASHIEKAISMAEQIHGLVFLDVQPGWSTVEEELPRLAPYLKRPNVELALDPEFALTGGKRPGTRVGTLNAAQINFAARFLAKIVRENHVSPKILIVHRFTEDMVTGFHAIKPLPEVEIVMDMDGFGSPVLKISTYKAYIASQPVQFTGFKLFYKNDVIIGHHLMTPAEILRLSPQPSYIMYQ